ncbi:MAG: YhcH/YjgK/YiaL family protein [Bryobacteraceae bacterium]
MDRRKFMQAAFWSASAGTLMLESAPTIHIRHGEVKKWRSVKGMEGLEVAMEFLSKPDLASMKEGRYPLEGEEVYALIMKMKTKPEAEGEFETHRRYIDVQSLISGQETIGYASASSLKTTKPYDEKVEAELFSLPPTYGRLQMKPGMFAIFAPGEAHLPGRDLDGEHEIRKVVVKVSVAWQKAHAKKG